jgi:hypothetical protein
MNKQRMMSFRNQRVGWTFAIFFIVFCFTTAVLWNHLDSVLTAGSYRIMARAGLLLLPAVALMMTIWELFVDDDEAVRKFKSHPTVRRLKNFCFYGSIVLALCEVAHAGGILTFDSSTAQQERTIAAVGEAQARIAGAQTAAAIEASGKQAQEMNARGQRQTARRTIQNGKDVARDAGATAQKNVTDAASATKAESFLPDWYLMGGMYVALPALGLVAFALTMIFARQAAPNVDRNDDGRPDIEQEEEFPDEIEVGK